MSVGTNEIQRRCAATIGSFTVDAAAAASGAVTLTTVTAGGNATISMGAGTGLGCDKYYRRREYNC